MKSPKDKLSTVIQKNTFHYSDSEFEEEYEGYINSLKETLLIVKNKIEIEGLKKEIFDWLLKEKENGLKALLALTGISNEYLKRLVTIIRVTNDPETNNLVFKEKWDNETNPNNIQEWSDIIFQKKIQNNEYFRKGLINVFLKVLRYHLLLRQFLFLN